MNGIWVPDPRWKGKGKKLEAIIGFRLSDIKRKAKYILFSFSRDGEIFWAINHLAMSGGWLIRKFDEKSPIYTRISISLMSEDQTLVLDFVDHRHFGKFDSYTNEEFWGEKIQKKLSSLGPDALTDDITIQVLNDQIHKFTENHPKLEIKPLLMEQTFLAGIGNIYASEICFLSGINPFRRANTLSQEELIQITQSIPHIMKSAYENGGSTIRTYKSPSGKSGWADRMIYGVKYCRICQKPISKGPQAGRTTYWCSNCQVMQ